VTETALATAWFEERYRAARADGTRPGWADLRPNPNLTSWLDRAGLFLGRAVVVGCGYGDDAGELARRGFSVTAFDVAPTAVDAATERFPGVPVDWRTGDLFDLPPEWIGAFDLVVEIFTVQALPLSLRLRASHAVRSLVAPGGTLFLFARGRDEGDSLNANPPWPLTPADIAAIDGEGFERLSFEDYGDPAEEARPRRFRAVWRRAPA